MPQIIDPLPPDHSSHIHCCYVNATNKIQIARITNIPNWYFERVVFPGQHLVFESVPEAQLEIHTGMMASAILSDTIPCQRLRTRETVMPPLAAIYMTKGPEFNQEKQLEVVHSLGRPTAKVS